MQEYTLKNRCHYTAAIGRLLFCIQMASSMCALIWNKAISRITTENLQKAQGFLELHTFLWSLCFRILMVIFSGKLHCFMIFFFFVYHWRNSASNTGSQTQPAGYNLCGEFKWVRMDTHFPYFYIYPKVRFSTIELRQKEQLLVFRLRWCWRFTWSLQNSKKYICNLKSKVFIVLQR